MSQEHPLNNGEAVENGLHENGVTEVPEEAPVVERAHSPDADLPEISTSTATTPTPTITPSSSSGSISNPSSYGEDIFGKFKHTDVPKLQSIFFAFFDNDLGSQILYQVPPTTATVIQRFPIYANVILPKDELLNRLVKINFGDCKIISHPVGLTSESDHVGYERGVLLFNMCFVVCEDSRADCMYEPIVQKIAEYLTELEQESWFISEPSTRARLPAIMESIFEQINAKGECVLPIDGTMTRIYLKMCPSYRGHEPPKVALYMVPMLTRNVEMTAELVSKMDVLSQKIIPKIDGVRCVKEIACEVDIDADLVSRCIRNLFFYECVSLVPLFLYQNTYVSTEKLHDFYQNPAKIQECIEFVRLQKPDEERGPLPLFSDVFRLYLSLTCGYTMDRWCQEMKPQRYNVDERRLVQFGMYYRFVRKLSVYPVTTVTSEANRSQRIFKLCDGTKALEDLAVLYSTPPSDMYHFLKQSGKFEFISK